ncbi:hypothetical protein C3K47_05465 [Solitalea longa]|uniref:Uncharacterized protein n=1 Tax=Solitalea longa TaxID=2079460 RepID=A0A2S5A786_9SPHI|nr:DUF6678 family protein [Solitalea longa]POY37973.1 hypothetical protein C3K47_05465 [Solitalea longa]
MTLDPEKYQQKLDLRIADFSTRFMNNAKWSKLFKKLSENCDLINKCLVKDVLDNILREIKIPALEKFDETFYSKGINDIMVGGPSTFKAIEWIEFPYQITERQTQDLLKIKNLLEQIGQLEIEYTPEKLMVFGYK